MATKVAEVYADLSIRGDDFDERLTQSRRSLEQLGQQSDESSERVRQGAIRSASAYERVRTEADKAATAQRTASQKASDARERELIVIRRLEDAQQRYGTESEQAVRAQQRVVEAHREAERAAARAERATDQLTIVQRRQAEAAQRAAAEMRRASQEVDNAMPSGSRLEGFTSRLGQLGEQGAEVGGNFGGSFMAGLAPRIASLGSKGGPIGAAIAGVAVIGLAAGALMAKSIQEGMERNEQENLIQAQLGIDDATTARLGRAASEAYMANFGETVQSNMETIKAAMSTGLIPRDADQGSMQKITEQLATVSKALGTDMPETARAAGQAIKTGLVGNATEAFDLLTAAGQHELNISGDLLDTINEYGTQFRKLGLDGVDALGLISQATHNGARDTDVAADAIKEFAIRAVDGSKTTAEAFQTLGLNADDMAAKFAKGGPEARAGLDQVLDAIRLIPDDAKRGQVAAQLFGSQWEDLGGAFSKFDLSTARQQLGDTAGAAQRAADTIGKGPGAAMEQAKRTIEESTMSVKQSLADAFGPAVADVAKGISSHKEEITKFFADVISAALTFGIAMGNAAAGFLHIWAETTGNIGKLVGKMLEFFGGSTKLIGEVISHIPKMESVGNAIRSTGEAVQQTGDGMTKMGDAAHGAANFIADTLVPGMASARDRVQEAGDAATSTSGRLGELGDKLRVMPDGKTITLTDNSPETRAKLEELGYKVETLPDGTVKVTANTKEAFEAIQGLTKRETKIIDVVTGMITTDPTKLRDTSKPQPGQAAPLHPDLTGGHADGGPVRGAGGPRDDSLLRRLSNGEYVQNAAAVSYYGVDTMDAINNRRIPRDMIPGLADGGLVGYGLPAGASGGFPDWVTQLGAQYGVTPSTYAGHQESDRNEPGYAPNPQHLNRGIDWGGPVDKMQKFAEAMMAAAANDTSIEQVIWMNPQTGQKLGWHGRQPDVDGSYYANDYPGHQNHVHTRFAAQVGAGTSSALLQNLTLTPQSSREEVARKIIAEGKRRGYSDTEIQAILATAIQESNLDPKARGGGGAWHGVFQQDSSYPGRDDPNTNITAFYDRLDQKKSSRGWSADPYANIFWLQQRPGESSADAALANGRRGYYEEIKGRAGEASQMYSAIGATLPAGGGLGVYVINPDGTITQQEAPASSSSGTPPEDPYTTTVTFNNPLEPFWWKGEKEYRERIINDYKKQEAWQEYWQKAGSSNTSTPAKGEKLPTMEEAQKDLQSAQTDLRIAQARERELDPKAEESSKLSTHKSVTEAQEKVNDALKVIEQIKQNPSGYLPPEVKKYAMGDIRDGHQPVIVSPGDYRVFGEPESGGESYIPHALDRRDRAIDIWAKTGRILGVKGYAAGGFGGYSDDTRDASAPKNLYDLLTLGVGGGFMAADLATPYIMSAITGKVDLGSVTPTLNTKANSADEVSSLVGQIGSQALSKLDEVVWAIKNGHNITIKIDGLNDPMGQGFNFTSRGM